MLQQENTILVVVDIQGKLANIVHEAEAMVRNAKIMIQGAKILGLPIIATEQYPKGLGHTVPEIAEHFGDVPVLEKGTFSCCGDTAFLAELQKHGRKSVLLCGIETHVCVYQTAQDLLENGYEVHLVTDAVSSRTPANKQLGIQKIASLGGTLTGTEMSLFELLRISGTDEFKAISKLVK